MQRRPCESTSWPEWLGMCVLMTTVFWIFLWLLSGLWSTKKIGLHPSETNNCLKREKEKDVEGARTEIFVQWFFEGSKIFWSSMIQGYLEVIAFICCPNQLFRCSAKSSSPMIGDLTYSLFSNDFRDFRWCCVLLTWRAVLVFLIFLFLSCLTTHPVKIIPIGEITDGRGSFAALF